MENPIGIFDSGLGGLTVLKEIEKLLPEENLCYLGDTARVPYGTKGKETVVRYSLEIAKFLKTKHIKILVVACNTASAYALEDLTKILDIPVIGVVEPGAIAAAAASTTNNKKIGVIGTKATIQSEAYVKAINSIDNTISVIQQACPLFVPLAEEGLTDKEYTVSIAEDYLGNFKSDKIDTLLLGCTHYPILQDTIGKVMGPDVTLIDSALTAANAVKTTLDDLKLHNKIGHVGGHKFFVTDSPSKFVELGSGFYGHKLDKAELINLEDFHIHG